MRDRWPWIVILLMLVPVCVAMLLTADGGIGSVFEGKLTVLFGLLVGLVQPPNLGAAPRRAGPP